ncbi:MAG: hypothetical protein J7M38_01255, partial [Armatimonadetes bacterium]|nr:hypothetical protein [Armatimonadota bacterium]
MADGSGVTYPGGASEQPGVALGGLGTSTLEIGRDGAFADIRVQNDWCTRLKPTPPATFLSVHARSGDEDGTGRVLQLEAPEGLEGVAGLTYTGRFPFVEISYHDDALPCEVELEAFSPFVPLDADASSLPLVFFTVRLHNPGPEPLTVAAALSWVNNIAAETREHGWPATGNRNTLLPGDEPAVLMDTLVEPLRGSEYLLACLPADGVRCSAVADWWRPAPGRWMGPNVPAAGHDAMGAWRSFLDRGTLPAPVTVDDGLERFSPHQPVAAVAGEVELAPGEQARVHFALVWFFPHHYDRQTSKAPVPLGHHYAGRFPGGARDVLGWAAPRREQLRERSGAWRRLIEESSLPPRLRALTTEVLYLLPRISWWLADGRFCLYESINCPRVHPTLLEVYMAPVLAALFPDLHARALRNIAEAQLPSGEIPSTLGRDGIYFHEYRVFNPSDAGVFPIVTAWEMLWGGDEQFARDMYPVVKRVLQWGEAELDADRDGVPDVHGIDQGWDTFPMRGAAAFIADQWIAALQAGEWMARRAGDTGFAQWCRQVRDRASDVAENRLWNGSYYDLCYNPATDEGSDICFADQFTYGTLPAMILELGDVHPPERLREALRSIWRLNVATCRYGARMGSLPDGSPADSSVHENQRGGASQSNAFTPVSTAPLAALAISNGMVDEGLALAEQMADTIINHVKGPWSAELLFDSNTAECFYGLHYSDCLIVWDVMHALIGAHINALEGELKLAPPRLPVKAPVFGRLFCGQVEFAVSDDAITLTLSPLEEREVRVPTLRVQLPPEMEVEDPVLVSGKADTV